jgi:heme-degrading monooxygenase HmoA
MSALLPQHPHSAVIFTSQRTAVVDGGYGDMADHWAALAARQCGYLGAESALDADRRGITVSCWYKAEDIGTWRRQAEHRIARDTGRRDGPRHCTSGVTQVERADAWAREGAAKGPQP